MNDPKIHPDDQRSIAALHSSFCDRHGDAAIALQDASDLLGLERGREEAQQAARWKPIESAPRDDDEVMLWKPIIGRVLCQWREHDDKTATDGEGWYETWSGQHIDGATHWLAVPQEPA